jgi:ribonuclease D
MLMDSTQPQPVVITTTADLEALCKRLAQQAHIAVDTEFMRETTYYAKLCLIQVGSDNEEAIIDPLAKNIDLTPLFDLMQNEHVLKVFHAGRQDLEIIVHLAGKLPRPCYDTQIAAMVCGFGDQVGYDRLVHDILGIPIDKGSRFTDWSRRPLNKKQISYALNDVVHLNTVFPILRDRIDRDGRSHWIEEEMQMLEDLSIYVATPNEVWRKIKQKGNKPPVLNRLKYLAAWREREAQKRDVPKSRLIKDEVLMAIAQADPSSPSGLGQVRGFPGGQKGKLVSPIFKILEQAGQVPKEDWPRLPPPPRHKPSPAVVEMLRVLLKHIADEANIAPRLIANAADLDLIALGETDTVKAMSGWRYDLFGQHAEAMKSGKTALAIKGSHLHLTTPGD